MRYFIFLFLLATITSCDYLDFDKKKAIEICQTSKVTNGFGILSDKTWKDWADEKQTSEPNTIYHWEAESTKEKNIYLVSYCLENKWGVRWEVNTESKSVVSVDDRQYLSRKYGLRALDESNSFETDNIRANYIYIKTHTPPFDKEFNTITYTFKATITNNTKFEFSKGDLEARLELLYKDKDVIEKERIYECHIYNSEKWLPKEKRDIEVEISVDDEYLKYTPEFAFFSIRANVEDIVGNSFNKDIVDIDIIEDFKKLQNEK